ncbi:hypothetical protein [Paracidovorax citrulli]|uniref:hypothetical protein n=1 Tax=Paracidovorax citrulli TaxID=80869 RepID=UPI000AB09B36|nr:hypothetical protein [Paracidovorax citrulli]
MIRRQMFTAGADQVADPGEVIFQGGGTASSQTVFSWVVPTGVYEVCVLAISSHKGYSTKVSRGSTDLVNTTWPKGSNSTFGGDGGDARNVNGPYNGGGGAGGYEGNGGLGMYQRDDGGGSYTMIAGTAGSGGGGGGGGGTRTVQGRGGGVGIYGIGNNGAAGDIYTNGDPGKHGSDFGLLRAGAGTLHNESSPAGVTYAKPGGNLRYRNALPVTPGETLTITLDHWIRDNAAGVGAIVRILWGGGRYFPGKAQATVPIGQVVVSGANATWTVPAGVTSVCLCAQQHNGDQTAVYAVLSSSTIVRAQNGARFGDGGGDGGGSAGGGGGAGGYEGNGGDGGGSSTPVDGEWSGLSGTAGQGGGGAGGSGSGRYKGGASWGGGSSNYLTYPATAGGNTGLSGKNASGTYTDPIEGDSGGGAPGQRGGALAWRNNVAVSPGQVISIFATGGRVRIIWGPNRSYPNNALKVT